MYGLEINSATGLSGYIEVPGLGARPVLLGRWVLERKGKPGPNGPIWQLRASIAYKNDVLVQMLPNMGHQFYLELTKEKLYQAVPEEGVTPVFEDGRLIIERLHLCPVK